MHRLGESPGAGWGSGEGSILLIDGPYYQDFAIKATGTLDTNAENAGLVFGYIDREHFW